MEQGIILGIDPGTTIMGYALLQVTLNKSQIIKMDVVNMKRLPDQTSKMKEILDSTLHIIEAYHPTLLAIEAPFYGKNPQSMLKLGRAQGIVIAAALHAGMEVFEYSPRKIKQSITGNGSSSKEQVAAMLKNMYGEMDDVKYLDATDALAVAVCHHLQNRIELGGHAFSGWQSFLSKNSDRIIK